MPSQRGASTAKSRLLKVVLLGDGGVGKSSLMNRFVSNKFDAQSFHTIGVEFLNKDITIDHTTFTLQIWDTAGQERFKSLRTPFYRGADCCLLTYGVNDIQSFKSLSMWRKEFLYYADVQRPEHFPFVVLGNKVDMEDEREVSGQSAETWCATNGNLPYFETSAKDSINVETAFVSAVKRTVELEKQVDSQRQMRTDTVDLNKKGGRSEGCC